MNKLNLSIGILSWKRNDVLRQTLLSYKKNGLLETSNDITVFFNEMGDEEVSLAKEFGLKHIGSTENIGIKNGYKALVDNAKNEYFLFLENDWYLFENRETTQKRLESGIEILSENKAQVVRYRSRKFPGFPCGIVWKNAKHPELTPRRDLTFVPCISENPCEVFPEIKSKEINGETYYFFESENSLWTNNPCLFKTDFIRGILAVDLPPTPNPEKKTRYGTSYKNISLEGDMEAYWPKSGYITATSEGLFSHLDYIENFKPRPRYNIRFIQFLSNIIINPRKRRIFRAKYSFPKAFYE